MSLQVKCSGCSKPLAMREELFGKQIKCPECGTQLLIKSPAKPVPAASIAVAPKKSSPQPERTTAAAKPAAAETSASGKLRVACKCGSKLSVPKTATGNRVRCPKCKAVLKVPAGKPAAAANVASAPTKAKAPATGTGGSAVAPVAAKEPRDWGAYFKNRIHWTILGMMLVGLF